MIGLNFVLFVIIACGQVSIFIAIKINSMRNPHDQRNLDMKLASRLSTVVVSDFLCWFPIGVLGLLAANNYPVPGEVNVAMAIFVLPLNSALNPLLYTLNSVLQSRNAKKMESLSRVLEAKIRRELKHQN